MNTRLGNGLKTGALLAVASTAFGTAPASAKDGARSARCDRSGGYEVRGTIEPGGMLKRVAGAATARRADDRYSGTLTVNVLRGNKRGRRDLGLHTYAVSSVRLPGIAAADQVAPIEGARVTLGGKSTAAKRCAGPERPKKDDAADQASEGTRTTDEAPPAAVADVTVEEHDAPVVTDVVVRVVRLAADAIDGGDDPAGDEESSDDNHHGAAAGPVDDDRPAPRADEDDDARPDLATAPGDDDDRGPAPTDDDSESDEI